MAMYTCRRFTTPTSLNISDEFLSGGQPTGSAQRTAPCSAIGQRVFVVGEDATSIMDLTTLRFGP